MIILIIESKFEAIFQWLVLPGNGLIGIEQVVIVDAATQTTGIGLHGAPWIVLGNQLPIGLFGTTVIEGPSVDTSLDAISFDLLN